MSTEAELIALGAGAVILACRPPRYPGDVPDVWQKWGPTVEWWLSPNADGTHSAADVLAVEAGARLVVLWEGLPG